LWAPAGAKIECVRAGASVVHSGRRVAAGEMAALALVLLLAAGTSGTVLTGGCSNRVLTPGCSTLVSSQASLHMGGHCRIGRRRNVPCRVGGRRDTV
jgi:hypothetical protein